LTLLALMAALLPLSCTEAGPAGGDPVQVVERYLKAKVAGDAQTVRLLLCAELEHLWEREVHSFDNVDGVRVEDLACRRRGAADIVDCTGEIVALYGGDQRVFPLSAYRVVYEAGDWRWCGETR
jgi:hypothetical protein